MDGKTWMSLSQWLQRRKYRPILTVDGLIGIHDTADIAHDRTWLFALWDYRVSSCQAGVIWLISRGV